MTGSDDNKVKVVVAETGRVIYDTAFHDDWVRTVLYTTEFFISGSDDGQVIQYLRSSFPCADQSRTVRIYNASTGTTSREAWSMGRMDYIMTIAMSPDNKILAAGSDDYSIMLYDMDARKIIHKPIKGHNGVGTSDVLHIAYVLK